MGFNIGSIDQKQHLNLSNQAWMTIEGDIDQFILSKKGSYNLSGFLNTIFKNFYEDAKATITLRLDEQRDYYEELFSDSTFDKYNSSIKNDFINKMCKTYQYQLLSEIETYPKGEGKKFRISNENLDILEEIEDSKYYNHVAGTYLKGIYEEYALKPYYEREQIVFKPFIDVIQEAIQKKCKIKMTIDNGKKFLVSPYSIISDKTTSYNYLVGYSHEIKENDDEENDIISTYRLSRISDIKLQKSKSSKMNESKKKEIEQAIDVKGLQFLSLEDTEIVLKLTPKGIEKYKSQLHLRPHYSSIKDQNMYTFHCTELQILYYFFKFGRDVTILSPIHLREQFIKYYQSALNNYIEDKNCL